MTKRTKKSLSNIVLGEESYSYDAAGNITDAPESCFEYDTNNRLVSFGGQTVSYDLDGNMLSATLDCCTSVNFAYDSANRLISAGGHSYTYNAEDVRIRNLYAGQDTTYTYDTNCRLSKLLCKTTNNVTTKYVYGRGLIGEETINTNSFKTYHFDCRGSTVALTNASGTVIDTFEYDTYGKLINRTGPSDVIFGYNGRDGVVTDENGFIYMRARYYSPDMRRFVNADIVAGAISEAVTLNRYAYANGNPVSNIDPFGLTAERGGDNLTSNNWLEEDDVLKAFAGRIIRNPWNELEYSGQIHNEVVRYLAKKYNFEKNYGKINPKNVYDLYSPTTHEYWEVKPVSYLTSKPRIAAMKDQMERYDGDGVIRGKPLGYDETFYLRYTVRIFSVEPGKVFYTFEREEKQQQGAPVFSPFPERKESSSKKEIISNNDWQSVQEGGQVVVAIALILWGVVRYIASGGSDVFGLQQGLEQLA